MMIPAANPSILSRRVPTPTSKSVDLAVPLPAKWSEASNGLDHLSTSGDEIEQNRA